MPLIRATVQPRSKFVGRLVYTTCKYSRREICIQKVRCTNERKQGNNCHISKAPFRSSKIKCSLQRCMLSFHICSLIVCVMFVWEVLSPIFCVAVYASLPTKILRSARFLCVPYTDICVNATDVRINDINNTLQKSFATGFSEIMCSRYSLRVMFSGSSSWLTKVSRAEAWQDQDLARKQHDSHTRVRGFGRVVRRG